MIPARIIITHQSQGKLDRKLKYCLHLMRHYHPDWEVSFFSDEDCRDFMRRQAPQYAEIYDWYPRPVLKADFFRLAAVHVLGGFYLDSDFLLWKSLEPLRENAAVFPWEGSLDQGGFDQRFPVWFRTREQPLQLGNYAFGAEAGHPFIGACLDELVTRTENFDAEFCHDLDVLHATGPDAVTTAYYREREKWSDVQMLAAGHMGLGDYGVHLVHGSWGGQA